MFAFAPRKALFLLVLRPLIWKLHYNKYFYRKQYFIRMVPGLSHQNLQFSPGLRQTNSCARCSHPCEQRSSTQYCPGDFDGAALRMAQQLLVTMDHCLLRRNFAC